MIGLGAERAGKAEQEKGKSSNHRMQETHKVRSYCAEPRQKPLSLATCGRAT
jgi:hypothetical protein